MYEIVNSKNILILILCYNNCNYYKIRILELYIYCEILFSEINCQRMK